MSASSHSTAPRFQAVDIEGEPVNAREIVCVRWHLPGAGVHHELYDTAEPGDMEAWSRNDGFKYPCQVLARKALPPAPRPLFTPTAFTSAALADDLTQTLAAAVLGFTVGFLTTALVCLF